MARSFRRFDDRSFRRTLSRFVSLPRFGETQNPGHSNAGWPINREPSGLRAREQTLRTLKSSSLSIAETRSVYRMQCECYLPPFWSLDPPLLSLLPLPDVSYLSRSTSADQPSIVASCILYDGAFEKWISAKWELRGSRANRTK